MKTLGTPVQLIVGLGNPGPDYAHTRHNAGQDFVEQLAQQHSQTLSCDTKFFGLTTRLQIAGNDVRLLIPTTFMNCSGKAVSAISQFYKIPPQAILVVHDELDLNPGIARLKIGGGHGGHNGLRDIIASLGNQNMFGRLRLGIGHPGKAKHVSNYVLKKAPSTEQHLIDDVIQQAMGHTPKICSGDWEAAMRELHSPPPP